MAAAKPMPLPVVDDAGMSALLGVPHTGKGQTDPGGRPKSDDDVER
jgi:hypothetical protein